MAESKNARREQQQRSKLDRTLFPMGAGSAAMLVMMLRFGFIINVHAIRASKETNRAVHLAGVELARAHVRGWYRRG